MFFKKIITTILLSAMLSQNVYGVEDNNDNKIEEAQIDVRVVVKDKDDNEEVVEDTVIQDAVAAAETVSCFKKNRFTIRNIVLSCIIGTGVFVGGLYTASTDESHHHYYNEPPRSTPDLVSIGHRNQSFAQTVWNKTTDGLDRVLPTNVFGEDNREIETTGEFPFSAIGRIQGVTDRGYNYICSGSLIAPDLVLTAAHCVQNVYTDLGKAYSDISFSAGMIQGQSHPDAVALVTQMYRSKDYPNFNNGENIGSDWAILRINKRLGDTQGWLGVKYVPEALGRKVNLGGYSADIHNGNTMSVHRGCEVKTDEVKSYSYDCDLTGGSSGAPLTTEDYNYAIAVNSHNYCGPDCGIKYWSDYDFSVRNVGVDMQDVLLALNRALNGSFVQQNPGCPNADDVLKSPFATGSNEFSCNPNGDDDDDVFDTPPPPRRSMATIAKVGLGTLVCLAISLGIGF